MPRYWKTVGWGQVSELRYGKAVPKACDCESHNVPVIGTSGVFGWTCKPLATGPKVIVGRKGTLGVQLAKGDFWTVDTAFWLEESEELDPYWAYYRLRAIDFKNENSGSAVPSLTRDHFYALRFDLPPLEEQRRIAAVLRALDDLIEVNRKIISDLVNLGDAVFDRWAAGIEVHVSLGDVMKKVTDGVESSVIEADEVYLGLEHFGLDGAGLIARGTAEGLASNKIKFTSGDVLYGKLRPYFRKVVRPAFSGVCSTEAWVLRGKGNATQEYIHWIARRLDFTQRAMAGSEGTKMPRANWGHVTSMSVPDPSSPGLIQVSKIVLGLWEAASSLEQESDELAHTRDELLPLLLSGRVRLGDFAA